MWASWSQRRRIPNIFHIISLWKLLIPWAGPVWTPEILLVGMTLGTTRHCYILNIKAVGLLILEKIVSIVQEHLFVCVDALRPSKQFFVLSGRFPVVLG